MFLSLMIPCLSVTAQKRLNSLPKSMTMQNINIALVFECLRMGYDVIGMVKKTPKMFFRYNGEDMSLTSIYNKNKKRR